MARQSPWSNLNPTSWFRQKVSPPNNDSFQTFCQDPARFKTGESLYSLSRIMKEKTTKFNESSTLNNSRVPNSTYNTDGGYNGILKGNLIYNDNNNVNKQMIIRADNSPPSNFTLNGYYNEQHNYENQKNDKQFSPSSSPDDYSQYAHNPLTPIPGPGATLRQNDSPQKIILELKKASESASEAEHLEAVVDPDVLTADVTFGGLEGFDKLDTVNDNWQQYLKFFFCHVGLLSLLVGYTIAGAFIFITLEHPMERDVKALARTQLLEKEYEIIDFIIQFSPNRTDGDGKKKPFKPASGAGSTFSRDKIGEKVSKPIQRFPPSLTRQPITFRKTAVSVVKKAPTTIKTAQANPQNLLTRAQAIYQKYHQKEASIPTIFTPYNNSHRFKRQNVLVTRGHKSPPVTVYRLVKPRVVGYRLLTKFKERFLNKTHQIKNKILAAPLFSNRLAIVSSTVASSPSNLRTPLNPIINRKWDKETTQFARTISAMLAEYSDILLKSPNHFEVYNSSLMLRQDNWSLQKATFFSATVISTIGYGNIAPHTVYGRVFCILYAIFGIPLLFLVVADLGTLFAKFVHFCWVKFSSTVEKNVVSVLRLGNDELHKVTKKIKVPKRNLKLPIYAALALMAVYMAMGAALFTIWEDWSFFDAFYFVFITMTTIGFGDVVPVHTNYLLMMMVYILIGLATMTTCIELVIHTYTDKLKELRGRLRFMTEKTEETLRTETLKKYLQNPEIMNRVRKKLSKKTDHKQQHGKVNTSLTKSKKGINGGRDKESGSRVKQKINSSRTPTTTEGSSSPDDSSASSNYYYRYNEGGSKQYAGSTVKLPNVKED